jgi:hypothetical protein
MLDKNYQTIERFSKNDRNRNISVEDTSAGTHAEEGESSIDHFAERISFALFLLFHEIGTKGLVSQFSAEFFLKAAVERVTFKELYLLFFVLNSFQMMQNQKDYKIL